MSKIDTLNQYIILLRLNQPIGFLLLMLPCMWGVLAACNSINDINNLLLSYIDLFKGEKIYNHVFTLDGTMNYVLGLLIEHCNIMSEPV